MARKGVNRVTLLGRAGGDPELRYTADGLAIASVSLAINDAWKDKSSGESKERTEWVRVKFFGSQAEVAGRYVRQGDQVYVEGELRTEQYEKEGVKHYSTAVVANDLQLLGNRSSGEAARSADDPPPED